MKLQKAIELSKMLKINLASDMDIDDLDAVQLLIEAGKRLQWFRSQLGVMATTQLPGETEE